MATFLEAGLFGYFNSLFIFLFVLVASYAILTSIKIFGDNAFINAVIAFILAAVFASSSFASQTFVYATPWLVLLFIILIFIAIIFRFLGAETKEMFLYPVGNPTATTIIALFIAFIFILSAGQVGKERKEQLIKEGVLEEGENKVLTFPGRVGEILQHPAVLGLIIVLLIAVFAIMLLAASPK